MADQGGAAAGSRLGRRGVGACGRLDRVVWISCPVAVAWIPPSSVTLSSSSPGSGDHGSFVGGTNPSILGQIRLGVVAHPSFLSQIWHHYHGSSALSPPTGALSLSLSLSPDGGAWGGEDRGLLGADRGHGDVELLRQWRIGMVAMLAWIYEPTSTQ